MSDPQVIAAPWWVYMVLSSDKKLYTGITNDVAKRWHAHCHLKSGAKFFRGRSPEKLLYVEECDGRSHASKRESAIKKLTRSEKLNLVEQQQSTDWHQYYQLESV